MTLWGKHNWYDKLYAVSLKHKEPLKNYELQLTPIRKVGKESVRHSQKRKFKWLLII